MSSRITCEVRDEAPVAVVRLCRPLDLGTMRTVHQALDGCAGHQPDALVVDLAEVTVRDRLALSVFAATARQADDWPAVPVVLCSPPPDAARLAGGVHDVPGGAGVGGLRGGDPGGRRDRRAPGAGAAGAGGRGLPAGPGAGHRRVRPVEPAATLAGPAALVLSELVGNVVRHAGTPMQVTVTLRRPYLQLAVVDGSRAAARPGRPNLAAEGGRGLLLVRELAQRWGSVPAGQGKAVWAMLPAT